jgi:hypothetical protein
MNHVYGEIDNRTVKDIIMRAMVLGLEMDVAQVMVSQTRYRDCNHFQSEINRGVAVSERIVRMQ